MPAINSADGHELTAKIMTHKRTAEVKSHYSQQQVPLQESNSITAHYSQILNEGYVYDNEDLIAAQLNAAYSPGMWVSLYSILAPLIHRVLYIVYKSNVIVCSMCCIACIYTI